MARAIFHNKSYCADWKLPVCGWSGFTRQQVQDYVNGWAARHPDSTSKAPQGNEEAAGSQVDESDNDSDKRKFAGA